MHVNVRAYMHMNVRACMRTYVRTCVCATPSCDPLMRPQGGGPALKIARVSNTNNFVPVFLGCISRCKIISAQVDCTNYHQAKQD